MSIPEAIGHFAIVVVICIALSATYAFVRERVRRPRRAGEGLDRAKSDVRGVS